eukprot:4485107-Prorocentrum_lima.AAC.1
MLMYQRHKSPTSKGLALISSSVGFPYCRCRGCHNVGKSHSVYPNVIKRRRIFSPGHRESRGT